MTENELKQFQVVLTARVAELEQHIHQRDGIKVERSADQLDDIQQASERTVAIRNLDHEFIQLRNARAAILRIEDGSFGTCLRCDERIHPKRLAAVPWTSYCIRCQEAVDRSSEETQSSTLDLFASAA